MSAPFVSDAMLLAADRAWRRNLGSLYCKAHAARAAAIREIWQDMHQASGTEARQGGDGLSGSVHDGPAPKPDAQNNARSDQ